MKKVVYVLGAGFSAPLGIPVMADFLSKAKDMYAVGQHNYQHFGAVFKMLQRLHVAKSYYETVFNIEEVLSILEMENYLDGDKDRDQFTKFIQDVIVHYTPHFESPSPWGDTQSDNFINLFGGKKWRDYFSFIASLCNLTVWASSRPKRIDANCSVRDDNEYEYSVVTLNYDLVVENVLDRLRLFKSEIELKTELSDNESINSNHFYLAKLHGTVKSSESSKLPNIVPPTWSKGSNEEVRPAWRLAFNLLRNANYIRVLGYSLPESDAYVRYLFKSAILDCEHLKGFDVITKDNDGDTQARYDKFLSFRKYRFQSSDLGKYMEIVRNVSRQESRGEDVLINYDQLEDVHKRAMRSGL